MATKDTIAATCVNTICQGPLGASAPLKELQKKFGFVPDNIVAAARQQVRQAR